MAHWHTSTIALSTTLAAACASGASSVDRAAVLLSPAPPPEGRICEVAATPSLLPSAEALVDSARLVDAVRSEQGEPAGYALLSLRFGDQGQLIWVRVLETDLRPAVRDAVQRIVVQTVRPQAPSPTWSVRLKLQTAPSPGLQVGRSEVCRADPHPGSVRITGQTRVVTSTSRVPPAPPPIAMPRLSLLIDVEGRVRQTRLVASSGDLEVDRQVEEWLQGHPFFPALLDGQAVEAWAQWPRGHR